ncbi:glycosyltransferase family 39 protein [Sporomusa sp.]|uniref:ArnT family glycosyltransferase n=1 Tax=Sporomusa sp. TaxID=2078658 RepID=UPI002BF62D23|nr:glycosyltransferase family 39 protein [Sporomusa sp.]HWR05486.1 glycosyltransferase family 39 protein [Sporomusa sp.]
MVRRLDSNLWVVAVIALIIMFFNLGSIPLLDPDEPVYAETPKEMIQFNEFLSPRIYGEYWYDKPPLYYWLVTGAFKVFGMSEFSARFPSAFLGVAGVLALYWFGRELFNKRAALAGALVLATSIEYFYLGKAAVTDITLNFCLTLALLGFITKRYYVMYIFTGLATVAKGPVGFLFPGAVIFLYLAATSRFRLLKEMKLLTGIGLFAVTALPWYLFMYSVHGSTFIDTFLGFHNVTRFTSPEHPELVVWYYFIPVLLLGFFPWTSILFQSVWVSLTQSSQESNRTLLFLNIWAVFIFIFFSISQTKLVSYILPMYPPLALIAGWYIDRVWGLRARRTAWPVILSVLSALLIAGMFASLELFPALTNGVGITAVLFSVMALCSIFFIWKRQIGKAFWVQVIGMTLFSMVLVGMLFSGVAPYFTSKYIAHEFTGKYDGKSPVYVMKFLRPGFAYYTDIYGIEVKAMELPAAVNNAQGKAYFVTQQADYKELTEPERMKVRIVAEAADRMILIKE